MTNTIRVENGDFLTWKLKLKALTWLRFCSRECVAHFKMQFLSFLTLQNLSCLLVYICFKSGHISPTKFCVPPSSHPCPCAGRILFSPILNFFLSPPLPSISFVAVMFCLGLCILWSMRHQFKRFVRSPKFINIFKSL